LPVRVVETFDIESADAHLGGAKERIALQILSFPKGHPTLSTNGLDQQHIVGIVKPDAARATGSHQSPKQDIIKETLPPGVEIFPFRPRRRSLTWNDFPASCGA
jgi:hypothetical protein